MRFLTCHGHKTCAHLSIVRSADVKQFWSLIITHGLDRANEQTAKVQKVVEKFDRPIDGDHPTQNLSSLQVNLSHVVSSCISVCSLYLQKLFSRPRNVHKERQSWSNESHGVRRLRPSKSNMSQAFVPYGARRCFHRQRLRRLIFYIAMIGGAGEALSQQIVRVKSEPNWLHISDIYFCTLLPQAGNVCWSDEVLRCPLQHRLEVRVVQSLNTEKVLPSKIPSSGLSTAVKSLNPQLIAVTGSNTVRKLPRKADLTTYLRIGSILKTNENANS